MGCPPRGKENRGGLAQFENDSDRMLFLKPSCPITGISGQSKHPSAAGKDTKKFHEWRGEMPCGPSNFRPWVRRRLEGSERVNGLRDRSLCSYRPVALCQKIGKSAMALGPCSHAIPHRRAPKKGPPSVRPILYSPLSSPVQLKIVSISCWRASLSLSRAKESSVIISPMACSMSLRSPKERSLFREMRISSLST